ncbi:MAG: hypothetical protein B6245_03260 [Desulfobacteraceae bacterium 4572_88]|nr:MAG: hypothetical protein B6245_03260 [Desulfobacteraceae bacterium 4572_88]
MRSEGAQENSHPHQEFRKAVRGLAYAPASISQNVCARYHQISHPSSLIHCSDKFSICGL